MRAVLVLADDIIHLVVLLLEHPGLALVQLAHHPEHVALFHLQPGALPPGVLVLLQLGVPWRQL